MTKKFLVPLALFVLCICLHAVSVNAQPFFVATDGSDSNSGTELKPFLTITKAVSMVQPGQTIYVRGGTYNLSNTISLSKSGSENAVITLLSYPGERPVLNFASQSLNSSNKGITLTGSYWHIKGIEITSAGDNGMVISGGTNNTIENCSFYRNRDSGLQLDNGAAGNRVLNCDSYFNADPTDYGDADGFAPKMNVGAGNYFYGCRSWKNCDDGWDGYLRGTDNVSTIIENCWSFENGYLEDGTDPGSQANGNGFKMGGSDDKSLKHDFTLKNCLAFRNKAKGFDQNSNKGSMILYNCTGHINLVADYRMNTTLANGKVMVLKNCVTAMGKAEIGSFAEQQKNSWLSPFAVTIADFISTLETEAYGPRKADGSLPDISYMHLAAGSDLIDGGVNVGLPFTGTAPDLGCFEAIMTGIKELRYDQTVSVYPNPVNERGWINFTSPADGRCEILLFDITGKRVMKVLDQDIEQGHQQTEITLSGLPDGIYIVRLTLNGKPLFAKRIVKLGATE